MAEQRKIWGELYIDEDGKAHLDCHIHNSVKFEQAEDALVKFVDLLQDQIDRKTECPLHIKEKDTPDRCEHCGAPTGQTEDGRTRFDSSQYHMDAAKKLSTISLVKGGWLDAIKAIDWLESQTADACDPYPRPERDQDREWLMSNSPTPEPTMEMRGAFNEMVLRCADEGIATDDIFEKHGLELG